MRMAFFSVPIIDSEPAQYELNRFLAQHRVVSVDRQLVVVSGASVWALCVSYIEGSRGEPSGRRGQVDYREVLTAKEFAVYVKLRELRKSTARQEGVPPYAVFNNEQLATMVQQRIRTSKGLAKIDGIGQSRISKYGPAFLEIIEESLPLLEAEQDGQADQDKP